MAMTCSRCGKEVAPGCTCTESIAAAADYAVEVVSLRAENERLREAARVAPTDAAIAESLPVGIHIRKLRECWCVHERDDGMSDTPSATGASLAEALAALWLVLKGPR